MNNPEPKLSAEQIEAGVAALNSSDIVNYDSRGAADAAFVTRIYLAMTAHARPAGDEVERVARALVEPLGYTKQAADNWDGVWVGNQTDTPETGSLAYLCRSLARAALSAMKGDGMVGARCICGGWDVTSCSCDDALNGETDA